MYRTHHCHELRERDIGRTVTLAGWVNSVRDHHGVIFVDLRDREGITQVVFRPEENADAASASHKLRDEDVIQVTGRVEARLAGTENDKLATGAIEVVCSTLVVLNRAEVLPFQLDRELSNEDLRLKYRYLDLRRPRLTRNIRLRHRITAAARNFLDEAGFVEVETPILSNPTPEGARDFLVPSRLSPGRFYALPQAPQQYKQLLQVAGLEKYFQIARCFRDEDLRADRQPEFTQIDIEASFVDATDIQSLTEGLLAAMFQAGRGVDIPRPFPRMTWREAMDTYGSDKPDTRFDLRIVDLADVFGNTEFRIFRNTFDTGGVVRAINATGFAGITTGQMNRLNEVAIQAGLPVKTLAFVKREDGEFKSPLWKFFTDDEKDAFVRKLNVQEGDIVFFVAGERDLVSGILGRVRLEIAEFLGLTRDSSALNFLWVVDFPLLARDDAGSGWTAVHHPFTRPHPGDVELLDQDPGSARAAAYDVVLNGYELGGGSIRIHERPLQERMFSLLGIGPEEQRERFGHLLDAFRFGAPPHGGIALGLDRITMLIAGEPGIREVIAFPKNNRGADLMTDSPTPVEPKLLRDLSLQSTARPKEG